MTAPNHIAGGIVLTGLFGSFMGLNILASPSYILTTIFIFLLPDIDHSKSLIGKLFLPLSRFLNRRFGHRTITHSLMALFVCSLLLMYTEAMFFDSGVYTSIFFLAYSSHLILDMMTKQGVPLFYPFLKNSCVLPGNPDMRFQTGNLHSETMIFCFFLLSGIFLQPLMKNGFWTQYNRFFGTVKHLASEFNKSSDALIVIYKIKKGTEIITGSGTCINASQNKIVLLQNNEFTILDKANCTILEVIPKHTGQSLAFQNQNFVNISLDSLNHLIESFPIQKIELEATNNFQFLQNGIPKIQRKIKLNYPNHLFFQAVETKSAVQKVAISNNTFSPNPKIKTLNLQIEILQEKQRQNLKIHQSTLDKITSLQKQIAKIKSLFQKEKLYQQIQELQKVKTPKFDDSKIKQLKIKIQELLSLDKIKRQEKLLEQQDLDTSPLETLFTGSINFVKIATM